MKTTLFLTKSSVTSILPWGWVTAIIWYFSYGVTFSILSEGNAESTSLLAYALELLFIIAPLVVFPSFTVGMGITRKMYMRRLPVSEKQILISNILITLLFMWAAPFIGTVIHVFKEIHLMDYFLPLILTWLALSSVATITAVFPLFGPRLLGVGYLYYLLLIALLYVGFGSFTFIQQGSYFYFFITEAVATNPLLTMFASLLFGSIVIALVLVVGFRKIHKKEGADVVTD
ncbi:hypothetical protein [Geomicrobium sp. JCM 19038]|uniref:hypothetical protein n=1 Tax=Geomicrobium sp. JCM 19038 TaxID=1460635 RepID=UPI00045F24B1|nr:hypothetical protein [Geomicrobium sp. JCM 19038]GAK10214.1 hypothetical protein JCM19038_4102 [Geomicrobium sp. JCM 19038]